MSAFPYPPPFIAFIDNPTLLIRLVPTILLLFSYDLYLLPYTYIRIQYFSSSFLFPTRVPLTHEQKIARSNTLTDFLYAHTHSLSLSLSRESIDKPSRPDSIIFSYFIFFFFFTPDPVIPLEAAGKFQRNSHFPTFCRQEHFLGKRAAAPLLHGSLTHPASASCRLCYTSLDSKTSLLESDDSSPSPSPPPPLPSSPSQSPPIPSRVEIHLREEKDPASTS